MAIDPGDKRIGIALSDPTGTIANPLSVLRHTSRIVDAAAIADLAREHQAGIILVGQALDDENQPNPQGRKAARLAEAIAGQTPLPVVLWDESYSSVTARQAKLDMGVSRRARQGHHDELAATYLLQTYLDSESNPPKLDASG
jgi:putative Holliday junction resolvase